MKISKIKQKAKKQKKPKAKASSKFNAPQLQAFSLDQLIEQFNNSNSNGNGLDTPPNPPWIHFT